MTKNLSKNSHMQSLQNENECSELSNHKQEVKNRNAEDGDLQISSKIAIVTGNRVGLGKALTDRLHELGFVTPDTICSKDYDLRTKVECDRLIEDTLSKYGRIDLLINNVGNFVCKDFDEMTQDDWNEMMDSNLNNAYYLIHKALPELRKNKGDILNIGFAGMEKLSPAPDVTAYQVAKTGLLTLTKALAKAEAANNVTINMMSPGQMENTVVHPENHKVPIGRLATLDEAVDACFFLIRSNYITGQNLELAGGWNL